MKLEGLPLAINKDGIWCIVADTPIGLHPDYKPNSKRWRNVHGFIAYLPIIINGKPWRATEEEVAASEEWQDTSIGEEGLLK